MLLPCIFLAATAGAADVVAFGDSWAEQSGDILGSVIQARHGLTVDNRGVGGSTAEGWNTLHPSAFVDAVSANPDATWVWLSILGNDTMALHSQRLGAQIAGRNDAALRTMLDRLFATHPDIRVAIFSYDWVNFDLNTTCRQTGWLTFPELATPELIFLDLVDTPAINRIFVRDIAEVQAAVASDHPNVWHTTVYGTLQADAGEPVTDLLPSPASRMGDCIHPNDRGYRRLHEVWTERYFGATRPTATVAGPSTVQACAGDDVTLSSTSQADGVSWWEATSLLGQGAALTLPASTGTRSLTLKADRGAWRDETTVNVTWEPPPTVDAGVDQETCAGGLVTLEGRASTASSWRPTEGLDDPSAARPRVQVGVDTTFTLTAGAGRCVAEDAVTIRVTDAPTVRLTGAETLGLDEPGTYAIDTPDVVTVRWRVDGEDLPGDPTTRTLSWSTEGVHELVVEVRTDEHCLMVRELTIDVQGPADTGGRDETAGPVDSPPGGGTGPGGFQVPGSDTPGGCCATTGPNAPAPWLPLLLLAMAGARRRP